MLGIEIKEDRFRIAVMRLTGVRLESGAYARLRLLWACARNAGARGLVIDLAAVEKVSESGVSALLEFAGQMEDGPIALTGVPDDLRARLHALGADVALPIFMESEAAIASLGFARLRNLLVRCVILAAPPPGTANGRAFPGIPLLERLIDFVAQSDLPEPVVALSGLSPSYLAGRRRQRRRAPAFFLPEDCAATIAGGMGAILGELWGSGTLGEETVILPAMHPPRESLLSLLERHRASGAWLTPAAAAGSLVTSAPFVIGAEAMTFLTAGEDGARWRVLAAARVPLPAAVQALFPHETGHAANLLPVPALPEPAVIPAPARLAHLCAVAETAELADPGSAANLNGKGGKGGNDDDDPPPVIEPRIAV